MTDERHVTALLQGARRRISDPQHWSRAAFARTAQGRPTPPPDPSAASWCAIGALQAEAAALGSRRGSRVALQRLALAVAEHDERDYPGISAHSRVAEFNDRSPRDPAAQHALVVQCFDEAIRQK